MKNPDSKKIHHEAATDGATGIPIAEKPIAKGPLFYVGTLIYSKAGLAWLFTSASDQYALSAETSGHCCGLM